MKVGSLVLMLAALLCGHGHAAVADVEAVPTEAAGPAVRNLIAVSPHFDERLGIQLSYERLLWPRRSLRLFAEHRNVGYLANPNAQRSGGGIGYRLYRPNLRSLAGLFFEINGFGYHVQESNHDLINGTWTDLSTFSNAPDLRKSHTMFGGGSSTGYQFALGESFRLTPQGRLYWLMSDRQEDVAGDLNGRVYAEFLLNIGYAF